LTPIAKYVREMVATVSSKYSMCGATFTKGVVAYMQQLELSTLPLSREEFIFLETLWLSKKRKKEKRSNLEFLSTTIVLSCLEGYVANKSCDKVF
jgi:hypothetical protein